MSAQFQVISCFEAWQCPMLQRPQPQTFPLHLTQQHLATMAEEQPSYLALLEREIIQHERLVASLQASLEETEQDKELALTADALKGSGAKELQETRGGLNGKREERKRKRCWSLQPVV